jgi:hypothetical protein
MSQLAKMVYDDPSTMHELWAEAKKDIIKAATATVNIKAALARKEAIKIIGQELTLRNNFTKSQIQFTPMAEIPNIKISAIHSMIGVTVKAPYMERQETGGAHTPSKGDTLAIPTDVARGGSRNKPVLTKLRVGKIKKSMRVHGAPTRNYNSQKSWTVARAYVAYTKNLFIPWGGKNGQRNLHQIMSIRGLGEKKVEIKTRQVYKFDTARTQTPATPWLLPACEKVEKDSQKIFESQMKKLGL